MNCHPTAEDLISLQDAAQSSGLSQGHLAHLIRSGDLWGKKIGRNWVTTKQAVEDYLATQPKPGPKPKKSH
jgi:hypothetical protein